MLRLQDIMTAQVVTISPELTLRECMELLAKHHISGAPVVAGGQVLGVLSASDIIAFVSSMRGVPTEREDESEDPWEAAEEWVEGDDPPGSYFTSLWADAGADVSGRTAQPEGPEWNELEEHTADEAMTRQVCALRPEMDARAAADYMRSAGVHRVLVMEHDKLLGIVSAMDLVKAVADGRFASHHYVFNGNRRGGRI